MRNIKLLIEYDGTEYSGWQIQNNAKTIQGELNNSILTLTGLDGGIIGSGRTDAGVHATGQVANFITNSKIPIEKFAVAFNSVLPRDIVIKAAEEVDLNFHSRFNAIGKMYTYKIYNSKYPTALNRNYTWDPGCYNKLDIIKLKSATEHFIGTHDFSGFMSTGSAVKDTIKTISKIDINTTGEFITIDYYGSGFLYNMVRIITGTIILVSIDQIDIKKLPQIIKSTDRKQAGITAPACGLYLQKVYY